MKNKLINFIKHNRFLYKIITFLYRVFYNFLGIFIRTKKTIMFSSFGGRKFDDSPYSLYMEIIKDHFFDEYEIVWAFTDINKFEVERGKKVKIDTFKFFTTLLSSKIWISNTDVDRGIGLRKKGVIRIETWHGTPLKKICGEENTKTFKPHRRKNSRNLIRCAQSEYDREIFARIFKCSKESILLCDLPRNDELVHNLSDKERNSILCELGIPFDKKIILYMPTYREYLNQNYESYIEPPIDFKKWETIIGNNFFVLFRAHYSTSKVFGIEDNNFIHDVSKYERLNNLYQISDILISDYSSAFFDFCIKGKKMLCFPYDLDEYKQKRGLYLDIEKDLKLPVYKNESDLLKAIVDENHEKQADISEFKNKFAPFAGNAANTILEKLKNMLS